VIIAASRISGTRYLDIKIVNIESHGKTAAAWKDGRRVESAGTAARARD
jgi:hypothetical protein